MGRPGRLTKAYLQERGVTEITKDGRVFMDDTELNMSMHRKDSRYDSQFYKSFSVYDPALYLERKNKYKAAGMRNVILSRAIWCWYYDGTNAETNGNLCEPFVCPANFDVDHINDDSLDDRFDNIQLMTRKQNLAKRRGHMNQYEASKKE